MIERHWRKSTYSGNQGDCVEVAVAVEMVGVRDTKNRDSGQLTVAPDAWAAFTSNVAEH